MTPCARTWLEHARHVRVLHVFDGACNLIDADSGVVALVVPPVGRGPFSFVVPPLRFPDHITPTDPVICRPDGVRIGTLTVDLETAQTWNPRPAWDNPTRDRFRNHRPLLIHALRDLAPANSLAALIVDLPGPLSETDAAILQTARAAAEKFIAALQTDLVCGRGGWKRSTGLWRVPRRFTSPPAPLSKYGEGETERGQVPSPRVERGFRGEVNQDLYPHPFFEEGITKLAGLGTGVTPAGDDWLVGGALAIWAALPETEAVSIGAHIAGTAAPRTTPLSAAWLDAAARGECHEDWHALLDGVRSGDERAVRVAAAAIIRHGHTSGADALAGFVMVLTALLDSPPRPTAG